MQHIRFIWSSVDRNEKSSATGPELTEPSGLSEGGGGLLIVQRLIEVIFGGALAAEEDSNIRSICGRWWSWPRVEVQGRMNGCEMWRKDVRSWEDESAD